MSNNPDWTKKLAPHVQAAIAAGAQPKVSHQAGGPTGGRQLAPHVQAAIAASTGVGQAKMGGQGGREMAAHVQAAIAVGQTKMEGQGDGRVAATHVQVSTQDKQETMQQAGAQQAHQLQAALACGDQAGCGTCCAAGAGSTSGCRSEGGAECNGANHPAALIQLAKKQRAWRKQQKRKMKEQKGDGDGGGKRGGKKKRGTKHNMGDCFRYQNCVSRIGTTSYHNCCQGGWKNGGRSFRFLKGNQNCINC
ncbi:MAG: hypothetical protein GY835_19880 [bacterium]|nr:hypothetical protein [bacterium]